MLAAWLFFASPRICYLVAAGASLALAGAFRLEALLFALPLGASVTVAPAPNRAARLATFAAGFAAFLGPYLAVMAITHRLAGLWACAVVFNLKLGAWAPHTSLNELLASIASTRPQLGAWLVSGIDVSQPLYLLSALTPWVASRLLFLASTSVIALSLFGATWFVARAERHDARPIVLSICGSGLLWVLYYLHVRHHLKYQYIQLPAIGLSLALALGVLRASQLVGAGIRRGGIVRSVAVACAVGMSLALSARLPVPITLPVNPFRASVPSYWSVTDTVTAFAKRWPVGESVVTDSPLLLYLLGDTGSYWAERPQRDTNDRAGVTRLFPRESFDLRDLAKANGGRFIITQWHYNWPDNVPQADPEALEFVQRYYRPYAKVGFSFYLVSPSGHPGTPTAWPMGYLVFRRVEPRPSAASAGARQ